MGIHDLLNIEPYKLVRSQKDCYLLPILQDLHNHHYLHSKEYSKIVQVIFGNRNDFYSYEDFPFLPVSAFKNHTIKSIDTESVFKVLTSSGTTGQEVSRVFLDRETAGLQSLALSKIISNVVGKTRLPMLIVDSKAVFSNKYTFSARGAGILGINVFGRDHTYILDEDFRMQEEELEKFLEKYNSQPVLIFGFTFMIWQYLYQSSFIKKYDLSKAILIHSGGWKKLTDIAVDNSTFRSSLFDKFGLTKIYNYYGMVEQVGSVFMENSQNALQCPNFAEVIIRNPKDFSIQPIGEPGLIQVLSALPRSYPGFSLLTEDIGVLIGDDDASNGWNGKYFRIIGRAKKAELRGCSDTFNVK